MSKRNVGWLALGVGAGALLGARVRQSLSRTGSRRSFPSRLVSATFAGVNQVVPWHRLPKWLGVLNLLALREELRDMNLHDTDRIPAQSTPEPPRYTSAGLATRTVDGSFNDLGHPAMGRAGTRFGRNVPLADTFPEPEPALLSPSPREVSRKLLTRRHFIPARTLNLLAAAWIQFQVHDWFGHGKVKEGKDDDLRISLESDDDWPERPMRIARTPADPTRVDTDAFPPTFVNTLSHWWDGSNIYGNDAATVAMLRSFEDGKLIVQDGGLPVDPETGLVHTGFSDNWWIGLALLHTLFVLEHNAICDRLKREYPTWSDERLFQTGRLINAGLMAKIHTVEWTPAILAHPTLQLGMRANWWGLLSEYVHQIFGRVSDSEILSGIPGSPTDHHGAPYALTEEFVAVYRLHPLIPDELRLFSLTEGRSLKALLFHEVAFAAAQRVVGADVSMADVFYSFGIAHPGAITLHNYPRSLQDLTTPDGRHIDLAAVDVMRDRERGVPRYNQFRRLLRLPPARSFEALTRDPVWARELREVYRNDIERVDLMVGMYAEPLPPGFGFSDTAFRVFILMASRRLKSDRFFTTDYTPRVYTQAGLDWINRNDMTTVLLRHYPDLGQALRCVTNAFAPWDRVDQPAS